MQSVCTKNDEYNSVNNPEPLPNKIDISLRFYDVLSVDEAEQTITLSMKAVIAWNDNRLDVNRSKEYVERYF